MAAYWVKTPKWIKILFPKNFIWDINTDDQPTVYITFDDGPNQQATPFALQQLEKYNAKATFFCVGNNVKLNPKIYEDILSKGHTTGNHTYNHINGWKTDDHTYLQNIAQAADYIKSPLYRPPYGKIKFSQALKLKQAIPNLKIIMWSLLSADFDPKITPQQCLNNVINHIKPGSIIIFHDSTKAFERMQFALPFVLAYCQKQNWQMKAIPY